MPNYGKKMRLNEKDWTNIQTKIIFSILTEMFLDIAW